MPLTVSRSVTFQSGGTVTVNVTIPDHPVNPCPVTFEADVSASNFASKGNYDAVLDDTFTGPHEPWRKRLTFDWDYGDSGHWPLVVDELPEQYSQKTRGLGSKTTHVYTDAAQAAGGTTYSWSLRVYDSFDDKETIVTGTVQILNRLYEASNIVLVNLNGDSDFSAFDSTGLPGTVNNENLGVSETFSESSSAFSTYGTTDKVVWLFKGNGETGSPVYDIDIDVPITVGLGPVFGSYGVGSVRVDHGKGERVIGLVSNPGTSTPIPFRLLNFHFKGIADPVTDISDGAGVGYTTVTRRGWWMISHKVIGEAGGPGGGTWQGTTAGTDPLYITLCECELPDQVHEYPLIISSGDKDGDTQMHSVANLFIDPVDKLLPDSEKNSILRCSGANYIHASKCRVFFNREASGQYFIKMGNGALAGAVGHVYFCVVEAGGSPIGFDPVGKIFQEYNYIAECNIFPMTPYTQRMVDCQGEGGTVRNNLSSASAWSTDVSQGDNTNRPRAIFSVEYQTTNGPTVDYVGAPNEVYNNTFICRLTSTQNGVSSQNIAIAQLISISTDGGDPDWTGMTQDAFNTNVHEPTNILYAEQQSTPETSRGPLDNAAASTTGPRTLAGDPISPKWAGLRTSGGWDTTTDLTGTTIPSAFLGSASPANRGGVGTIDPVMDYLGRYRGPKWSDGCAEDDTGDYVA